MERIVIATRSMDERLYSLSGELAELPFPRVRLTGTAADNYFYHFNEIDADWIINFDEDAFIIDPTAVLDLLHYMQDNAYDCCGVPDGGVISHRFHNPISPNPYFSIHNNRRIKERFNLAEIEQSRFGEDLMPFVPQHLLKADHKFAYDDFEPYYKYFFWLLRSGFRFLYLNADNWVRDPISTLTFNHEGRQMLLHCWYARDYDNQKWRFHHAINYCRAYKRQAAGEPNTGEPLITMAVGATRQSTKLRQAVAAALAQEADCSYEVLVIDGLAEGETSASLTGLEDSRLRIIPAGVPKDQASLKNLALAEMQGDFILWLGEEGELQPKTLASHLAFLKANPDVDVIYGNLLCAEVGTSALREVTYQPLSPLSIPHYLLLGRPFPFSGTLIRKSLFSKIGNFDPQVAGAHDLDFWVRAALNESAFGYNHEAFCKVPPNSAELASTGVNRESGQVIEKIIDAFPLRSLFYMFNWEHDPQGAETRAWLMIAMAFCRYQLYEKALQYIARSQSLTPSPEALILRGLIFKKNGLYQEAAELFSQVLLSSNPHLQSLQRIGNLL
ncbi:MAG: glycosyltransferase [Deltaproteobacteria bacterium]|nr:glycosyltransferase [Deltaproteobacteria bacterium]